jgi:hypothetical protein
MTLLVTVYKYLKNNELTHSAEHFSQEFLKKSRSWYAVQTHENRDFSTSAAIECLRHIRLILMQRKLNKREDLLLEYVAQELEHYLQRRLKVHGFVFF